MFMDFLAELGILVVGPQAQFIGFLFTVLITLVGTDVLTGWLKGWHQGDLDSAKNFRGYIRKATILLLAILGVVLDIAVAGTLLFLGMDNLTVFGLNLVSMPLVASIMLIWLNLGEILSILENLSAMGIRMPKFLEEGIKRIYNRVDEGDIDIKSVVKRGKDGTVIQNTMKVPGPRGEDSKE